MKVIKFDETIFDVLIGCGFRYCYSKTAADEQSPDQVNICLTPIGFRPNIRKLPVRFDTCFDLTLEPKQMAAGIDEDTTVFVDLDNTLLKDYYGRENTDN